MDRNLEGKMEARQIVRRAGLDDRPEYYSGRGATTSDLNDQILERVYGLVKREYGEEASGQFLQMVADIPVLSATDFLNTLYGLEASGWRWNERRAKEDGIDLGPDDDRGGREVVGMCTIAGALSGMNKKNGTGYIRGQFLKRHGVKNPDSDKEDSSFWYR